MYSKLTKWAQGLKREIQVLYFAYKDPKTPLISKVLLALTLAYAMSPIDLIPDFIPVLGYLDDLIILPFLIFLTIKTIPEDVLSSSRKKTGKVEPEMNKSYIAAVVIIVLWVMVTIVLIFTIFLESIYPPSNPFPFP
jgi:uncharacterized membrane protein YkvA (DUF1232 family)